MPYPNEHACRLVDPKTLNIKGSSTRTSGGKKYRIIFGIPKKGDGSVEQAYRYPKDKWSASEAHKHCKEHKGTFEAASSKKEEIENTQEIIEEEIEDKKDKDLKEIVDTVYAPWILEQKGKDTFLRGPFVEEGIKNNNNRIYTDILVDGIIDKLNSGQYTGFSGHPSILNPKSPGATAMKFTEAWKDDGIGFCRFKLLETTEGQNLKIVAEEKIPIGLSLRGYGEETWDKENDAYIVDQSLYELKGIDAVTEPACKKAQAIIEERNRKNESQKGGKNMDELKEQIEALMKSVKELTEKNKELEKKEGLTDADREILTNVKAQIEKDQKKLEAKKKVAEILENEELKEFKFKDALRKNLENCDTVEEVEKNYPYTFEMLKNLIGEIDEPEPTHIVINEQGFFGDKKVPSTPEEAYRWMLDKFPDKGMWNGLSALDNPRYCAKVMLDNYLKQYISNFDINTLNRGLLTERDIFASNKRNPLYYLTKKHIQETVGDTETITTDVAATYGYMLPVYTFIMQDLMEIMNQVVGVQPIDRPTAKIFFGKEYYSDGAGTDTEIVANFARAQAAVAEGVIPQHIKFKITTNTISLETAVKLYYQYTIELLQDMMANHGLNVDSIHINVMRREVMREISHQILYALLTGTSCTNGDNCVSIGTNDNYSVTAPPNWTEEGWLKFGLTKAVKQSGARINKEPWNAIPDTILADSDLEYLFTAPHFVSEGARATNFGFNRIGTFQNHYKVFTTNMDAYNNKILLTHRGSSVMEAAHLFLPYVPFWIGPQIATLTQQVGRACHSRFGTQKVIGKKIVVIDVIE